MKNILGFVTGDPELKEEIPAEECGVAEECGAVRSLVSVKFPDRALPLTYYNDRFDLREGDTVYVSGALEGKPGTVVKVTTRFKITRSRYEKIVGRGRFELRGEYSPAANMMVNRECSSADTDELRAALIAPLAEDDEVICGEGYILPLDCFEDSDDVEDRILERAANYCNEGRVRAMTFYNGVCTAFVEGTEWYEVSFRVRGNGSVEDIYCTCPYPGLCKHSLAALIILRTLMSLLEPGNFIALERGFFFDRLTRESRTIRIA